MRQTTAPLILRRSSDRGHADHGWLKTAYTFSFADYHDPAHMGFRSLRVINQDRVAPGGGFHTHPHRDMEIFSYVVEGAIEHQDSMGNGRVLRPGQIQLMSAGTGITHSEFNPSKSELLHLLQIWIQPRERGLEPNYTEWHPKPNSDAQAKMLLISPDGRENSATIQQDAIVFRLRLESGETIRHELAPDRGVWLQLIKGGLRVNGDVALGPGDGLSMEHADSLSIVADHFSEALLFDLK